MRHYKTTKEIIGLWPTYKALASDLSEIVVCDVSQHVVARWAERNSINARYDMALVEAAARRGFSLSIADLTRLRSVAMVKP